MLGAFQKYLHPTIQPNNNDFSLSLIFPKYSKLHTRIFKVSNFGATGSKYRFFQDDSMGFLIIECPKHVGRA